MKKWLCVAAALASLALVAGGCARSARPIRSTNAPLRPCVPAQAAADRTLGEQLRVADDCTQICALRMNTPEGAYHFIRTDHGVNLDGEAADAGGFERACALLFELPVRAAQKSDAPETLTITVEDENGVCERIGVAFDGEDAFLRLADDTCLRTDAWRVHTLALACDGARIDHEEGE